MTAETPNLDLSECIHFIADWCEITSAPHVTLTAITPDGPTSTATFAVGGLDQVETWIGNQQAGGGISISSPMRPPKAV
jgi:hypothetical protein